MQDMVRTEYLLNSHAALLGWVGVQHAPRNAKSEPSTTTVITIP